MNHETSWVLFSLGCPPLSHLDSCPCLDIAPRKVYCRRGIATWQVAAGWAPGCFLPEILAALSVPSYIQHGHHSSPAPSTSGDHGVTSQVGAKCSCFCSLALKGFSIHNKKVINVKLPLPAPTNSKIITTVRGNALQMQLFEVLACSCCLDGCPSSLELTRKGLSSPAVLGKDLFPKSKGKFKSMAAKGLKSYPTGQLT